MDADELDDAIHQLQRDRDELKAKLEKLRVDHDVLSGKLRFPGTKFLIDLEYRVVYDATATFGHAGTTGAFTLTAAFDTLPGTLHAVYALSAHAPSSDTPVLITDGSVIVAPANAITIALQRQRQTSPTRIEAKLAVYNSTASDQSLAIKVWRRLGMGS
jgi:hypothetical protein